MSDILIVSSLQQLGLQISRDDPEFLYVEAVSHIETGIIFGCSTLESTALSESTREFGPIGVCGHDSFGNDL